MTRAGGIRRFPMNTARRARVRPLRLRAMELQHRCRELPARRIFIVEGGRLVQ
jgi:hypothetical protein